MSGVQERYQTGIEYSAPKKWRDYVSVLLLNKFHSKFFLSSFLLLTTHRGFYY